MLLESIHECVRKPHFRAVHDATPNAFHERKNIVVLRIQYDPLGRRLLFNQLNTLQKRHRDPRTSSACNRSIVAAVVLDS